VPSAPRLVAVAPASPAERAGLVPDDVVVTINGTRPRDVLEYRRLVDEPELDLEVSGPGGDRRVILRKDPGERLGLEVHTSVFDGITTCDNHCEFCFIYQLPPGLRSSLYEKDDDYRLSFLYGNFTTLTRFTELDLERVVEEGLSPLNVSIHATDPAVRSGLLRNRRGAISLRWLRALLDEGVAVHGQVVVCPGLNDGAVLDDTLCGVLDQFPELESVCVVPLGISRFNREERLRPHTVDEARAVLATVHDWQEVFVRVLGRRLVHAADEYYLLAGEPFPPADHYDGFPMHEDGIGMARTFELELVGAVAEPTGPRAGFFASVDGAPAEGYRAHKAPGGAGAAPAETDARRGRVAILTGTYGATVLEPLLGARDDVRVLAVENRFFGGNIGVAGLLVGEDLARVLAAEPEDDRYLLPDVCLSGGRFLDGTTPAELPRAVEVVATDGLALRAAIESATRP
jgi:putative radical SAM enzyme (TIGR03279 family)